MSLSGLNNTVFPLTLDGTTSLDLSSLTIDGANVDLSNLVPYQGANQTLDVGAQNIRTTHVPATNPDVVNKQFLDFTINNLVISIAGSFLDKVTATPQTVIGNVSYTAQLSADDLVVPESKEADLGGVVQVSANHRRTESDAGVTANSSFGSITNSLGVYQATTTANFATLGLATVTVGKRYKLNLNVLGDIALYNSSLQLYASTDGVNPSQSLGASASFTPSSTIFQLLTGTFVPIHQYIILLCINSSPTGAGLTVEWFGLEVYETGVELEKVTLPLLTASKVPVLNSNKQLVSSGTDASKLQWLDNVTSDIQAQLNLGAKLAGPQTFTGTHTFNNPNPINLTGLIGNRMLGLGISQDVTTVSATLLEASYLGGVTSAIQTQIDGKVSKAGDTMTGALDISTTGAFPMTFTRTSASTNFGVGPQYSLISTGGFRGQYVRTLGGSNGAVATTNQNQANGYYCVDIANAGVFKSDTDVTTSILYMTPGSILVNGQANIAGANFLEFGNGVPGKEANAGRVGYQTFTTGCLDIVGAGTTNANRSVRIYDRLGVGVTPSTTFHVGGNSFLNGNVGIGQAPETGVQLRLPNTGGSRLIVLYSAYTDDHRFYGIGINANTLRFNIQEATTDRFSFWAGTGSTTSTEVFTVAGTGDVTMTGNVGIGTAPSTVRALRIARSYTMDFDLKSLISFENTAVGAAYTHWEVGPNVFGGRSRFTIRGGTKNFNTLINYFNLEDNGRATLTGVLTVTGGTASSSSTLTTTPGSLIVGDVATNYGGGWNAGLMMECSDTTEITIHDSGARLASFMYYAGSSFTIGRDLGSGWGVTPTFFAGNVTVNGTTNLVGTTTTRSLTLVNTHTLNVSNGNGTDGQIMLGWQGSQSQYRHRITTNHDGGAGPTGNSNSMSFYLWSTNDAVGAVGTNHKMTLAGGGVGIGTTTPRASLDVVGDIITEWPPAGVFRRIGTQYLSTSSGYYMGLITETLSRTLNLVAQSQDACSVLISTGSGPTERMRITAGGDVGIGTNAPTGKLDIYSTTADYTNTCVIRSPWASVTLDNTQISPGKKFSLLMGGPGSGVGQGNFGIFDITGGSYRFSIINNGSIGLGSFIPHTRVGVNGGNTGGNVQDPGAWPTDANGTLTTEGAQSGTAAGLYTGFQASNGYITCLTPSITWNVLYISALATYMYHSGVVSAFTSSAGWINVSDEREKEDIQDLRTDKSLQRVLALRPKHYRRKYDDVNTPVPEEEIQRRHVGFIAQEVQQTNPHCVSSWCKKSGKKAKKCEKPECKVEEEILGCDGEEEPEEEKEEDEEDEMRLGMSYNDYVVHLVGAVQEQQKHIQVLEEREKVWVEYSKQQEKVLADYKAQTDSRFAKMASLISQLIPK